MTAVTQENWSKDGIFQLNVEYPDYARVIVQSKDVDIHALIGNIGGYVGLFLGMKGLL